MRGAEPVRVETGKELRTAGRTAAAATPVLETTDRALRDWAKQWKAEVTRSREIVMRSMHRSLQPECVILWENFRTLLAATREAGDSLRDLRHLRAGAMAHGEMQPRVCVVAACFLDAVEPRNAFQSEDLVDFLDGYQQEAELRLGEIWALRPVLLGELLCRLSHGSPAEWPVLVSSIREVMQASWKEIFELVNLTDRVLAGDPREAYAAMDFDSRDAYRKEISRLARGSACSEAEVAEVVCELAREHAALGIPGRAAERRQHVGYYLLDRGVAEVQRRIQYRPTLGETVRKFVLRNGTWFYLMGIEVLTLLIVYALLGGLGPLTPIVAAFFTLLFPATQAAVDCMNSLIGYLITPQPLPKMDFSKGIPDDCATMVAVPTLLLSQRQVRDLLLDLEIRYLANRGRNLYFALLTDTPDSDFAVDHREEWATLCKRMIEQLNSRYGTEEHTPFFLFHRRREFNPAEGRWMGWERKRGKILDLNQLLRGGADAFAEKAGDLSVLPRIRYVITLDSDTQLPRDAAAKMIGTLAHPLNRAVVDAATAMVVEGYGILQPRVGVSVHSATRSRLARIYSGQSGFDIYTRAVSDAYQDLFAEGIFTGKGIYEVDVFHRTLQERFPQNALLSHDLIEGAYARAALVSDIEVIDDYPSHFSSYSRRKHRWVRGDWQILRWVLPLVPDFRGNRIQNPISGISRWKIVDNLRRSLIEPMIFVLVVAGWLYLPEPIGYWTAAMAVLLLLSTYLQFGFSLLRLPWGRGGFWGVARETLKDFVRGHGTAALIVIFLPHQALLSLDAIWRSVVRVFVTKKRLLEWETAAEAETAVSKRSAVDRYLAWTPIVAAGIAVLVWHVRPAAIPYAAPILLVWFLARGFAEWLDRPPRVAVRTLRPKDLEFLCDAGERAWRYFQEWSTPEYQWLIPDNVTESGVVANRLSPTNLGLLLNARIAAVKLGFLDLREFAEQTAATLASTAALEKFRGHLFNWYDPQSGRPLEPRFVSTVDSGNLAACLWTTKQAALQFAKRQGTPEPLIAQLRAIADECEQMVSAMDFRFLYQRHRKLLSVGYDVATGKLERASYELLASESRIAVFIAIAKSDIPQEAWFHLDRRLTAVKGHKALLSWSGTMFEYLMPRLWMRHHPRTILARSLESAVRVQRAYGRRKGVPWGISESGHIVPGSEEYGYYAFGVPSLALRRSEEQELVIAPYATFLALPVDPQAALHNLRRMAKFGWTGRYGLYEAIDYTRAGGEPVRSWMAHHLGMTLLALCNLLHNDAMVDLFHREPAVMATELLLNEHAPPGIVVEQETVKAVQ